MDQAGTHRDLPAFDSQVLGLVVCIAYDWPRPDFYMRDLNSSSHAFRASALSSELRSLY